MVRALQPTNASPDWKLPTVPEMEPLKKADGQFLHPFVLKGREIAQPVPTKAFLQSAKIEHMCTACHDYAHPPPSISPFLLAQNLPSKWFAPTDNMPLKLHDEYTHHQWLMG